MDSVHGDPEACYGLRHGGPRSTFFGGKAEAAEADEEGEDQRPGCVE